LFFCATLTDRRRGHTSFVQAGAETSNTGVEAVKPDVRPLRIPLMIHPLRRTHVIVVR